MLPLLLVALLTAPAPYRWRVIPVDGGGSIECLAVSPHDPALLLAGSDVGGFHRSLDGGRSWQVTSAGTVTDADRAVADLAFHPTDPRLVYAATGVCFGRPTGDWGRLLVSTDGGCTWSVRSRAVRFSGHGTARQRGKLLLTDPFQPDLLWAATAWDGVMLSRDRGASWTSLGLSGRFLVSLQRGADGSLYAAAEPQAGNPGGLYLRQRGGEWRTIYPHPVRDVAVAPSEPGRVLLATPDSGLLLSLDYGQNWINVTPAGFADRLLAEAVAFSPSHPRIGVATGLERSWQRRHPDVFLTLDGGRTWQPMVGAERANVEVGPWWAGSEWFGFHPHCLAIDPTSPRRVWFGDWFNIWGTHDGAASWFSGHDGLRTSVVRHLSLDPTDPNLAWLGLADIGAFRAEALPARAAPLGGNAASIGSVNGLVARREPTGTVVYLARGTTLWRQERLGAWTAVRGEAPGQVGPLLLLPDGGLLAEVEGHPLQVTRDQGLSWSTWGRPPEVGGKPLRLRLPVLLDAAGRILAALEPELGVYLSRDGGQSWGAVSEGLPQLDHQGRRHRHLVALAGSQGPEPVLYAANQSALWRSRDLGANWARILPRPIAAVAVDRRTGRLYVGTSGQWYQPEPPALLASDDAGESFTAIDATWPVQRQFTLLQPDPRVPGRVWVGTAGNSAVVGEPAS